MPISNSPAPASRAGGSLPDDRVDVAASPPVRLVLAEAVDDGGATEDAEAVAGAEKVEEVPLAEVVERRRAWPVRVLLGVGSGVEWCFGVVSLMLGLSVLATFPVLQFLSLGYLLEAAGRVARSGRIRDGFVGVRPAARVGGLVLGTWLLWLPLRFISDMWHSAWLIDPESRVTAGWRVALLVAIVVLGGQIVWAWYRGGRLRHFFWPAPLRLWRQLRQGPRLGQARDAVWEFVAGMRLPYFFWLGVRGFAGAVAWLFVPILLFIGGTLLPPGPAVLSGLLGAAALSFVLIYLPFLQTRFAAENRLVCFFEVSQVRAMFRRAPIAFWFALLITLLFALPLYLLKIELTPREVAFVPSLVFVAFIFPARLLTGWALARANRREKPRWLITRAAARLAAIPVVAIYVFLVFFTRYTSWHGVWSTFEQHAFLVPVPFLGL
ncbi:MAG: hypothetical protein J5I93_12450 [Pirellulaceae bacterium]|nr:hypothetical protein [Pirellulaceae bacterium]